MKTTVMSSKGQIVVPTEIRQRLHWDAGTKLVVEERPEGVLLRRAPAVPETTMDQVFGCLKYDGPAKTLEEMDAGIAEAVSERYARSRY